MNNVIPKLTDYFNFNLMTKDYTLYTAPEIINNKNDKNNFDIKADLWSVGLIMYELYFNKLPFSSKEELIDIINENKNLNLSKNDKDNDFNDLIHNLLKIDIDERLSFDEYINHNLYIVKV